MPTDVPNAAHRNASFSQQILLPKSLSFSGMILPGYGAAKATRFCRMERG